MTRAKKDAFIKGLKTRIKNLKRKILEERVNFIRTQNEELQSTKRELNEENRKNLTLMLYCANYKAESKILQKKVDRLMADITTLKTAIDLKKRNLN